MDQYQWWLNRVLERAFFDKHVCKENPSIIPFIDELVEKGLLVKSDEIYYELTEIGLMYILVDLWNQMEAAK